MAFMWRAAERGACGEWHAPSMGTFITWSTTGLKCVVVVMNTMHITQAFNQFFDSAVGHPLSTTMIRHIVDTEKFGQQLTEMEEFADMMGHSLSTQHGSSYLNSAEVYDPATNIWTAIASMNSKNHLKNHPNS